MVPWVPTSLGPVVCFLWARFWLRFIYSKFAACLFLFWIKWEFGCKFGCKFMMTPFHGCAFILIVSVLSVQASHFTSGTVNFRGTFKMLLAHVSCILISHNHVVHGLYIFTDWYQFWLMMSNNYVRDAVACKHKLQIFNCMVPSFYQCVLVQWVSSFGSGSMWEHFQNLNYCNLKMAGNTGLFSCQFFQE